MAPAAFCAVNLCLRGLRRRRWRALAGAMLLCCCVVLCVLPVADSKRSRKRGKKASAATASAVESSEGTCRDGKCERMHESVSSKSVEKRVYASLERQWKEYKVLHARMIRLAADPSTRSQARFVVFRVCCGELGNRLLGLASTLLYAFASRRALLIEWPEIEGFSGDSYEALFEPAHDMEILLPNLLREWNVGYKSFAKMSKTLEINNGHPDPYRQVFCDDLAAAFNTTIFVVLSTNQYFAPGIGFNEHHRYLPQAILDPNHEREAASPLSSFEPPPASSTREELLSTPYMFPPVFGSIGAGGNEQEADRDSWARDSGQDKEFVGGGGGGRERGDDERGKREQRATGQGLYEGLFGRLIDLVARPKARIRDKIANFSRKHFAGKRVVGIQMRRQNRDRDKKGAGLSDAHVGTFFECARGRADQLLAATRTITADEHKSGQVVYFLATDYIPSRREASQRIGQGLVYWNETVSSSSKGMENALIDLWLLGEADEIIVTSGSTFGYVAHARTAKVPWLVTLEKRRENKEWHLLEWLPPRCVRSETSEPCFHAWPFALPQPCFSGGYEGALRRFGQANCRPWDMEYFSFQ